MNYIDIIIIIILAIGAIRGFSRGFIIETATLVALLAGVYTAIKYTSFTEGILKDFFNIQSSYNEYIAFATTFLLVVIIIYIIGKLLTKLVDIISLGLVNKLAGTILGGIKAFIIICALLMITDALNEKFQFLSEETIQDSILFHPFLNFAEQTYHSIHI